VKVTLASFSRTQQKHAQNVPEEEFALMVISAIMSVAATTSSRTVVFASNSTALSVSLLLKKISEFVVKRSCATVSTCPGERCAGRLSVTSLAYLRILSLESKRMDPLYILEIKGVDALFVTNALQVIHA
jgi:hypothetical protein